MISNWIDQNWILDTSGVDNIDDNARENLLHDKLSLYLQGWSYSLARDTVSKHKLTLKKKLSNKALQKEAKKLTEKPQVNEWKEYYHIYQMDF